MVFEKNFVRVVIPLDPAEGAWYTEPIHDDYDEKDIDHLYNLTTWDEDWINPTTDGHISWEKDSSCQSDSNEELVNWQNKLQVVSTLWCNMLTKSFHFISIEARKLPYYYGLDDVNIFLDHFERDVP